MTVTGDPARPTGTPQARDEATRSSLADLVAPAASALLLLALSLPRLGRRPIWLDEAYTVAATRDLLGTWRATGGTMALYYAVMWPVAKLSTDPVWLRLPSVLFAMATVFVVHRIGRVIGGRRLGAIAAVLLAAGATFGRYALEARAHTLAALLVSLAWLGVVMIMRTGRGWALFAVATLLAPMAHGLAILQVPLQLGLLATTVDLRTWLRRGAALLGGLALEMGLLFALGAGEVADWIEPLEWRQAKSFGRQLLGRNPGIWLIGPVVVVAVVLAVRRARRRDLDGWLGLAPVLWGLGFPLLILGISVARPYAEPRYVLTAVPGVALLLAGAVDRLRSDAAAVAGAGVLAVALLAGQWTVMVGGVEDWPDLADRIAADSQPGDRLLIPAKLRPPLDYAWAGEARPELVPLSPVEPVGELARAYDTQPGSMASRLVKGPIAPVWYVDRDDGREHHVEALVEQPEVRRRYRVAGWWTFDGELFLVRLEPRT